MSSSACSNNNDDEDDYGLCEERQRLVRDNDEPVITSMASPAVSFSSGFVSEETATTVTIPTDLSPEEEEARRRHEELVRRAAEADLSSVETTSCIYRAGYDKQGRAVIVFVGKWFSQSRLDLDKALLYLVRVVEDVADAGGYVVVYFHARTRQDNVPQYWWIKHVYRTLPYKYKKNLKAFYVVHPTMWSRVACWWFSTFMAPAVKNKIHHVHALEELNIAVDIKGLSVPMFVTEQDMVINGLRYYQP